ncbi:hypothetical protein, partial [Salmonella sp. s58408]|uniref:hypothetical protein n=1 Tax=Salmonella sp. s58408 TaxID=3159701 RepID=UPI00397F70EE
PCAAYPPNRTFTATAAVAPQGKKSPKKVTQEKKGGKNERSSRPKTNTESSATRHRPKSQPPKAPQHPEVRFNKTITNQQVLQVFPSFAIAKGLIRKNETLLGR